MTSACVAWRPSGGRRGWVTRVYMQCVCKAGATDEAKSSFKEELIQDPFEPPLLPPPLQFIMGRLLLLAVFAVMVVCAAAGHGQDVGQPETFECLGKPDGYYADHDRNCVVYYRCAHGELTAAQDMTQHTSEGEVRKVEPPEGRHRRSYCMEETTQTLAYLAQLFDHRKL